MPKVNRELEGSVINMAEERAERKKSAAAHFGDYVEGELRANEIEEGLSEIYQDDNGQIVDMKNAEIEHGRSWLYRLFIWLLNISLVLLLAWVAYYYFYQYRSATETTSIDFTIIGPKETVAGQEVEYTLSYRNLDRIDLKNVSAKVTYPENFIFESAEPAPTQDHVFWQIGELGRQRSGEIKIKGRIIGEVGKNSIVLASLAYTPSNFSSEFKKDASTATVVTSIGLDFNVDFPQTVMVGESNDLYISYRQQDNVYMNKFRVTVSRPENMSFATSASKLEPGVLNIDLTSSTLKSGATSTKATSTAQVNNGELRIPVVFNSRLKDSEDITLNFEYTPDGQNYYSFLKKDVLVSVLSKSINLDLLINTSKEALGVNFGQALNYSIGYANKGEQAMKDLVVMLTIDGDFVDWKSLSDKNRGMLSGDKIIWTKDQIPDLASLSPGQEGTIDFSLNVVAAKDLNPAKNYQINNYARFSFGSGTSTLATNTPEKSNDRSNEIMLKINSDLSLVEQLRYFDDDNIAVGSGPQPPRVGQTTSYKIYWNLTNSLNELSDVQVQTTLPSYVNFDQKNTADLGTISFDEASHKVTWLIGKMPITKTKAAANFNISVTPTTTDADHIMMLINNSTVTAKDSATKNIITKVGKPKTTKLIDDSAVSDDGVVAK